MFFNLYLFMPHLFAIIIFLNIKSEFKLSAHIYVLLNIIIRIAFYYIIIKKTVIIMNIINP